MPVTVAPSTCSSRMTAPTVFRPGPLGHVDFKFHLPETSAGDPARAADAARRIVAHTTFIESASSVPVHMIVPANVVAAQIRIGTTQMIVLCPKLVKKLTGSSPTVVPRTVSMATEMWGACGGLPHL